MKNLAITVLAASMILSCTPDERKNHIIAIDNSISVSESLTQNYLKIVEEEIIKNMKPTDRVTLLLIDGCSQTQAERIFEFDLADQDFSSEHDGLRQAKDSSESRRMKFIANKLTDCRLAIASKRSQRMQCRYFTDIMSTLNEAAKLTNAEGSFSNSSQKLMNNVLGKKNFHYKTSLYIFSDMIHTNMIGANFKQFAWLQKADVEKHFNQLQLTSQIPNLSNADVFVCGATSSIDAGALAGPQIANINHFWNLYFRATGANLKAYGYDVRSEIKRYRPNSYQNNRH